MWQPRYGRSDVVDEEVVQQSPNAQELRWLGRKPNRQEEHIANYLLFTKMEIYSKFIESSKYKQFKEKKGIPDKECIGITALFARSLKTWIKIGMNTCGEVIGQR